MEEEVRYCDRCSGLKKIKHMTYIHCGSYICDECVVLIVEKKKLIIPSMLVNDSKKDI